MMLRLILLAVAMAYSGLAQGPLRFELKLLNRSTPRCTVSFEYPEIISAASPEARDRMNAGIRRVLLRQTVWPPGDSGVTSLEAYAKAFLESCNEIQKEPQRPLYDAKKVTILRYTPPILSFRCQANADGGGVHPFGTTFFVNFDITTGKTIALTDILREGALAKLESMAEANLRRDHGIPPTGSLSEHGYTFPDDRFRLNDNFGIGENDLVFIFNTYEVQAGAGGETEITISYAFLREVLKPSLQLEERP